MNSLKFRAVCFSCREYCRSMGITVVKMPSFEPKFHSSRILLNILLKVILSLFII